VITHPLLALWVGEGLTQLSSVWPRSVGRPAHSDNQRLLPTGSIYQHTLLPYRTRCFLPQRWP